MMSKSSTLAVAAAACLMTIAPAALQTAAANGSASFERAQAAAQRALDVQQGKDFRSYQVPATQPREQAPPSTDYVVPYRGGREY